MSSRRLRTLVLLAGLDNAYVSTFATWLKRRSVPEMDKRPEAHGGGRWDNVESGEEGRYAVVADYLRRLGREGKASVLDVGCGPGFLQPYLALHGYARYLGLDFAPDNIAKAKPRADARTCFEVADAAVYQPPQTHDLIVFNEMLYYLVEDPVACVRRYLRHLEPGGLVVISSVVDYATLNLIRRLRAELPVIDETIVVNRLGFGWLILAIRERG